MGKGLARTFGSSTGSGGLAGVQPVALTTSPQTITATAPTSVGQLLVIDVAQGTGNQQIAWPTSSSMFSPTPPVDINPAAAKHSRFTFVCETVGLWTIIGLYLDP